MVAATTAALFVLGTGVCLRRVRESRHFLPLAWIVLTFGLGGVLTYDPPYWPHLNLVLPAVALIAALGADELIRVLAPAPGTLRRAALVAATAATLGFTGVTNWLTYYAFVEDNAGPRIRVARFVDDLPDGYTVYLMSDSFHAHEDAFRFFNRDVPMVDVSPGSLRAAAESAQGPAVFVLVGHDEAVPVLTARHPDAEVETHADAQARPVFVSVTVDE
jgi:hypothetical protein